MRHDHYYRLRQLAVHLAKSTDALLAAVAQATGTAHSNPVPRKDTHMAVADLLASLESEVARATTAASGATVVLNGIGDRVAAAVAQAIANGATAEQLAPVSAEVDALKASTDSLAAAVAAVPPVA